jgi:hypothetical protein
MEALNALIHSLISFISTSLKTVKSVLAQAWEGVVFGVSFLKKNEHNFDSMIEKPDQVALGMNRSAENLVHIKTSYLLLASAVPLLVTILVYNFPDKYQLSQFFPKPKSNQVQSQILGDETVMDKSRVIAKSNAGVQMVLAETTIAEDIRIKNQSAQIGNKKTIQLTGVLTDNNGGMVAGVHDVRFAIYTINRSELDAYPSDSDKNKRIWEEMQTVEFKKGVFYVNLGVVNDLPVLTTIDSGQFFVGMRIGTDSEMAPRRKVSTPLFSLNSGNALLLNDKKVGIESGDILALNDQGQINLSNLPIGTGSDQLVLGNDKRLSSSVAPKLTISGANFISLSGQKLTVKKIDLASNTQGTLATSQGGLGLTSYTQGDILYYASGSAMTKLPIGTNGQVLAIVNGLPAWSSNASGETDPVFFASEAKNFTAGDKSKLDSIAANANNYSLPVATGTELGGIKIGSRLTVTDGVLSADIQTGAGGVESFNTRTGAIILTGSDVTTALTFTPYNSTNPNGYISDGNTNWDNSYGFITASSIANLTNKTGNISMWTNDTGYLSSFTEADPTLSTWIGTTNLSTLGTITSGTWRATPIASNYGGTGLTSYTAGDMLYYSSGTALSKLAIGSSGQVLVVSAGVPAWSSTAPGAAHTFLSSSHSDTTTGTVQRGDVITGQGSTASWTRLPIGTLNQILKSNGTDIYWGADTDTDTTYSKSGTLLQQSGTVFSLKEGTLTDTRLCTYSTANGLVCDTLPATGGTTYTAGNDLDLSGTQFDLEPQLDYVTTVSRTASNLTFQTTTSGHILISPADNVGIGTTTPTQKLQVTGYADATGLCINGSCKTSWTGAGIGTDYAAGNDIDITNGIIDLESQLDYVATINRTSNNLTLQTTTSGNIYLNPADNVGIGTNTPTQKLDVNGNLTATAIYTNNTIRISNTGALTNVSGNISQFTNNMNYITDGNTNWDNSYNFITASSLDNLTNKSGNISMWTNNAGYLSSFTEVDPTLSTWIGSTNLSTLGTITTGTWHGNVITTTYGGTGLTSYTAGDLLYYASGTALSRLAVGANGQILTVSGGIPAWASSVTASAHPFLSTFHSDTTAAAVQRGDVITGQGASATWSRLALGTNGKVLKSDGTDIGWAQL